MEQRASIWSTGFAMFAMFFGAGNIVFPLVLGQMTQDKNLYAVLGMIITAVFVPLLGLLAMLLYEGDYGAFFKRIGKIPGFILIALIMGLIGPFAGIPRCITISYSTLNAFGLEGLKGMNLVTFSLLNCLVIFLFTFRRNKILTIIGYVLTPILLLSLGLIVCKGFFAMPATTESTFTRWETFSQGFLGGYNTMDLLAAFFFSSMVLVCLRKEKEDVPLIENRRVLGLAVSGSLIAAGLLALVYISFTYLAAGYSDTLQRIPGHEILGTLAHELLGPYAGLIAGVVVSFACLTTEIALAAVFSEFLRKNICKEKISYTTALLITICTTFVVSTLHFEGISRFLAPILQISYPALIMLTVVNILHKLFDFKPVRSLVYLTFAISAAVYILL